MQATFAEHLEQVLGWDSIYAWNQETFGSRRHARPCRHQRGGTDPRACEPR